MAPSATLLGICFLFFLARPSTTAAFRQFTVGGKEGWREPESDDTAIYGRWASRIRFQIGDSVYFKYNNDSVLVVDKKGYYHCITANPIAWYTDGSTTINLDRSGPFYFISGYEDHCRKGQRLIIEVLTSHYPPSPHHHLLPTTKAPAPSPTTNSALSRHPLHVLSLLTAALLWRIHMH